MELHEVNCSKLLSHHTLTTLQTTREACCQRWFETSRQTPPTFASKFLEPANVKQSQVEFKNIAYENPASEGL